jgi:molecular chaperone GrpE
MTEEDAVTREDRDGDEEAGASDPEPSTEDEAEPLAARVGAHDEALGAEVARLAERVEALEAEVEERTAEVEDLTDRLQRTQADFQNYKKRAKRQQEEARERATADLVERLLEVRDNLDRALDQDGDAEAIREGVEATRRAFDDVLEAESVTPIEPAPGEAVDPHRHEVMMRVESDQPADTVAELYRPGYEMADTVVRTAQVAVSDGE